MVVMTRESLDSTRLDSTLHFGQQTNEKKTESFSASMTFSKFSAFLIFNDSRERRESRVETQTIKMSQSDIRSTGNSTIWTTFRARKHSH
jgi:hypothetical protein